MVLRSLTPSNPPIANRKPLNSTKETCAYYTKQFLPQSPWLNYFRIISESCSLYRFEMTRWWVIDGRKTTIALIPSNLKSLVVHSPNWAPAESVWVVFLHGAQWQTEFISSSSHIQTAKKHGASWSFPCGGHGWAERPASLKWVKTLH